MKVLHVIGPMRTGGAQTQLLGLVRAAHRRLWEATVVATSPGPMTADFRAVGCRVVELERRGSPGLLRIRALRRLVDGERFDVINSHLWQGNVYARIAVGGVERRPRVVIEEHNVESGRAVTRRALDRVLARWTDTWVAPTEAMARFLSSMHPVAMPDVVKIPYGIDKEIFSPGEPHHRAKWKVGTVARLDPEKSLDVLIDATRVLVKGGAELEVLIAGEGPLRAQLERRAAGLPVTFVGLIDRGAPVADFLRSLDTFVLPSRHREARPVAVLEAICCGVPVVATDIPGMKETVGGGAQLVPPGDVAALAETLSDVVSRQSAREAALAARQRVPSFEDVAAMWADLFSQAVFRT